ncbi:uncharacterized protein C1orf131 homolog isoform X2 [Ooceraea biroi]|uniref:uncharacterized protein C1orf131 homolog isoform X2 n=1 Tax=Ooceraea biroi TaxID=2015173 RepID=UPI0005BE0C67|nr:uncharacterized protein C1orf131 homolog isoform X2 [Ooceraea biroi]
MRKMEYFVPTRSSEIKKNAANDYTFVKYEAPKKKTRSAADDVDDKRKEKDKPKLTPAEVKKQQEKEMKKARYDVIKFGMSGFEKSKAKKAKVELAISLGAIPPKNRRMNYNNVKRQRKKEKEKEKKKEHISGLTSSLLKRNSKTVHKRDSGILGVYGKVPRDILSKKKS